ncbi:hypothetical protein ABBQ38_008151 [Trebouxia sp. C0009 RCD-2024]
MGQHGGQLTAWDLQCWLDRASAGGKGGDQVQARPSGWGQLLNGLRRRIQALLGLLLQLQADLKEGPDISLLEPALQRQWDHTANAHLGEVVIKPYSNHKVWWTCNQCPDGHLHTWSARVANRSSGRDCPQCSGHKDASILC